MLTHCTLDGFNQQQQQQQQLTMGRKTKKNSPRKRKSKGDSTPSTPEVIDVDAADIRMKSLVSLVEHHALVIQKKTRSFYSYLGSLTNYLTCALETDFATMVQLHHSTISYDSVDTKLHELTNFSSPEIDENKKKFMKYLVNGLRGNTKLFNEIKGDHRTNSKDKMNAQLERDIATLQNQYKNKAKNLVGMQEKAKELQEFRNVKPRQHYENINAFRKACILSAMVGRTYDETVVYYKDARTPAQFEWKTKHTIALIFKITEIALNLSGNDDVSEFDDEEQRQLHLFRQQVGAPEGEDNHNPAPSPDTSIYLTRRIAFHYVAGSRNVPASFNYYLRFIENNQDYGLDTFTLGQIEKNNFRHYLLMSLLAKLLENRGRGTSSNSQKATGTDGEARAPIPNITVPPTTGAGGKRRIGKRSVPNYAELSTDNSETETEDSVSSASREASVQSDATSDAPPKQKKPKASPARKTQLKTTPATSRPQKAANETSYQRRSKKKLPPELTTDEVKKIQEGLPLIQVQDHLKFDLHLMLELPKTGEKLSISEDTFHCEDRREDTQKVDAVCLLEPVLLGFYVGTDLRDWAHGQVPRKRGMAAIQRCIKEKITCAYLPVRSASTLQKDQSTFQDKVIREAPISGYPVRSLNYDHAIYQKHFGDLRFEPKMICEFIKKQEPPPPGQPRECNLTADFGFGNHNYDLHHDHVEDKVPILIPPGFVCEDENMNKAVRLVTGEVLSRMHSCLLELLPDQRLVHGDQMRYEEFAEKIDAIFPGFQKFEGGTWLLTYDDGGKEGHLRRHFDGNNDNGEGHNHTAVWSYAFKLDDEPLTQRLSLIGYTRKAIGSHMEKYHTCVAFATRQMENYLQKTPEWPAKLQEFRLKKIPSARWIPARNGQPMMLLTKPFPERCGNHSAAACMTRKLAKTHQLTIETVCELVYLATILPSHVEFYTMMLKISRMTTKQFNTDMKQRRSIIKLHCDMLQDKCGLNDEGRVEANVGRYPRCSPCAFDWEYYFFQPAKECKTSEANYKQLVKERNSILEHNKKHSTNQKDVPAVPSRPRLDTLPQDWIAPDEMLQIQAIASTLATFFGGSQGKKPDNTNGSFTKMVRGLDIPFIRKELKVGVLLEIAILTKLIPVACASCVNWNEDGGYKDLARHGLHKQNRSKKLDIGKLIALARGLANRFDMEERNVENTLCEIFRDRPRKDVFFAGQDVHCPVKKDGKWILMQCTCKSNQWAEDTEVAPCNLNN